MSEKLKLYAKRAKYGPGWISYIEGADDLGPDNLTGWGRTEAEAIADLRGKLEEME